MLGLLLLALVQDPVPVPNGARLTEGRTCYTMNMTRQGATRPIGVTLQTVERSVRNERPVLEVVVHQSINGGAFSMRDDFVLDAATLRPLSLVNTRHGKRHVTLVYGEDRITGERIEADGSVHAIDVPLEGSVWEGNLFGLTFAALPLAEGAAFSLPNWQYDKGFGQFSVRVAGSRMAETETGPVAAWVVESGEGASTITYLIGKADNHEISYSAAQGSQTPGGDCSALGAAQ